MVASMQNSCARKCMLWSSTGLGHLFFLGGGLPKVPHVSALLFCFILLLALDFDVLNVIFMHQMLHIEYAG